MTLLLASPLRAQHLPPQATIDKVRAAHQLACGVVQEDAEYSSEDDHSSRGAFDEAICTVVALAVGPKVGVAITTFRDESSALQWLRAGHLEMVVSLSTDAAHPAPHLVPHLEKPIAFSRPLFYDSLALLVPVASGMHRPEDLAGKKICVLAETGTEEALRAWFARHNVDYLPFPFQEEGEMEAAYISNNCAALAAERTRLSLIRVSLGASAAQHVILAEPLSRDPMSSATRANDPAWSRLVDTVIGTLLEAEQLDLTSANISAPPTERSADAALFLRRTRELGASLGLRPMWATDMVRSLGNYGEMYERTLGSGSDRLLPRDLNRLRRDGGLLVPLAIP